MNKYDDLRIILGSQSKGRKKVLEDMGYSFDVMLADIDEKSIRMDNPRELTLALAQAKAEAILPNIKEPVLLITSDQVVTWQGTVCEKPIDKTEARNFLKSYAQHPAETITAVVVTNTATGNQKSGIDIAKVWFKPIPGQVIDQAIREGNIFYLAGGFDIEDPLLKNYIDRVEGERESVIGLPKSLLINLMERIKK